MLAKSVAFMQLFHTSISISTSAAPELYDNKCFDKAVYEVLYGLLLRSRTFLNMEFSSNFGR